MREEVPTLLTMADVRRHVPYSANHLWRMVREGRFPKPLQIGPNRVAWRAADVREWIERLQPAEEAAARQRRAERASKAARARWARQ